jgi:hypothetical protein
MFCTVLPGVHPRRIISVRDGEKNWNSVINTIYYEPWKIRNFKSSSAYDKREPHLKQMIFRSFGIA